MKKNKLLILLLINCLVFINILISQNTWSTEGVLGGASETRRRAVAFSIGNKGYVGTGQRGSFGNTGWKEFKDFWEYNPINGIWTQLADVPGTTRYYSIGFSIDEKGYVGTGKRYNSSKGGDDYLQDMYEYDPVTNVWKSIANILGGPRSEAAVFTIGRKAYIGTGYTPTSGNSNNFYEFDPYNGNKWTQIKSFEGTERDGAAAFAICGKGYLGTGLIAPNTGIGDFWEYDPIANDWIPKSNFGGGSSYGSKGFAICSKGFILKGSENQNCDSKKFWEYNPETDTWIERAEFPNERRSDPVAFNIGGKGYVGTGKRCGQELYYGDFFSYTPLNVNVPNQPINIIGNKQVCSGAVETYYTSLDKCSKTYNWTVPQNSNIIKYSLNKDSITVKFASNSGNIVVTAVNDCGSSTPFSVAITVNTLPNAQVSGINSICNGLCTDLTATGGGTYLWSTGATSSSIKVCPTSTTTYIVTVTSNLGCSATASRIVTVNQTNAQVSGINSICNGLCTDLTASGGGTYLWNTGATTSTINVCPTSATTYTVTVTSNLGCSATASTRVAVNPSSDLNFEAPQNSGICPLIVDLYNRSITSNPVDFEWTIYNDASPSPSPMKFFVENPKGISYNEAGDFRTILKITDDCGTNTKDSIIRIICIVGTENNINEIDFSVYPNPTDGYITVVQNNNLENEKCKLTLINSIGKIIEVYDINNSDITTGKTIDLRNYNNGIYFVIISNTSVFKRFKICKL